MATLQPLVTSWPAHSEVGGVLAPRDVVARALGGRRRPRYVTMATLQPLVTSWPAHSEVGGVLAPRDVVARALGGRRRLRYVTMATLQPLVTSWPAHDLLLLLRDDIDFPAHSEVGGVFGPQIMQQLHAQLMPVPEEVVTMCADIMARRIDLVQLMRTKPRNDRLFSTNLEWKSKIAELDQETERLNKMVTGTAENLRAKINYALDLAKISWIDRDSLIKKLERAQKDSLTLQYKVEQALAAKTSHSKTNSVISNKDGTTSDIPLGDATSSQVSQQLLQDELNKERAARETLKNVVSAAENMLRVARARIATLERQLKDDKAELDAARRKQKEHDQLNRYRETSYETKMRKMAELAKTAEATAENLSCQRDALELRVKELRQRLESTEKVAEDRVAEQKSRAEALVMALAAQEKLNMSSRSRIAELEAQLKKMEETAHNLRERSSKLVDVERRRCLDYIPSKETEPSDRETEMWKELQRTRIALSRTEEELYRTRADKDNFMNSLSKIAQGDGSEIAQEEIATDLLEKEQRIAKLQHIIEEQRENEKLMEQSMTHYENQLANLRLEVKRLRNYDCYSNDDSYQELQTELLDMHMQVEALTRERTALVTAAASRALMLERHERAAELFARVTRARRDLAALIEDRPELPSVSDVPYSEISRSLSLVCMSSQETWSALRVERARVLRLESAVLAQSLQLEREGRVRTQLERRRAMLEREVLRAHCSHHRPENVANKIPNVVQDLFPYK
ncbi:hypothetical protein O0L34_g8987 [Tuta absoluta]|nr:hypothetical protein O0L34_g8987 [Tuta absoluta]